MEGAEKSRPFDWADFFGGISDTVFLRRDARSSEIVSGVARCAGARGTASVVGVVVGTGHATLLPS